MLSGYGPDIPWRIFTVNPAFELSEYQRRLTKVRTAMSDKELDALVIGDPANMNWLTGFDAWSFYVPQ